MKRVKSHWRCKLKEESLNDLMYVALSRGTVKNFNPEPAIGLWWNDAKKTRRLEDAYGPNQRPR